MDTHDSGKPTGRSGAQQGPPSLPGRIAEFEEPTPRLLTRLFAVPLVIVAVIIGCALLVTWMFGGLAGEGHENIGNLLQRLEAASGERKAGVLLPGDKELWQAAASLARRLQDRDDRLSDEELDEVVRRLSGLVERDLTQSDELGQMGEQRLGFFVRALSYTERGGAVAPLLRSAEGPLPSARIEALQGLARLREQPEVAQAAERIGRAVLDPDPTVQTVACWVMALIAQPGDTAVIEKLKTACLSEHREVQWNAALSLARLGSDAGAGLLLDMLDRNYWAKEVRVQLPGADGAPREVPMPGATVDEYLMAAIDAAGGLSHTEVRAAIAALESDSSVRVAGRAREVLARSH